MKEKEDKQSLCHCARCMQKGEMKCERDCQGCVHAIHNGIRRQEKPSSNGHDWGEKEAIAGARIAGSVWQGAKKEPEKLQVLSGDHTQGATMGRRMSAGLFAMQEDRSHMLLL